MPSLIETQAISKVFGGIHALADCTLSVKEGSITGLIGPNGSGKTTLFNVVTGFERPDKGSIVFNGRDITNMLPNDVFKLGISRTFQLTRIFPELTVLENMHIAVQRSGLRSVFSRWSSTNESRKAEELLEFVGILQLEHMLAGNLSYGQKKLLEFAFILISDPQVILLDEPAGGINPTMINYLAERIRTLNKQGLTFLIVEHNMEFVMELCDTVNVMHRGTKIAEGTPQEVRDNPDVLTAYLGE